MSALQVTVEMVVVLSVTVMVTVTVPVNTVELANSSASGTACGTGRNAPVCGSRYPRIPGLAGLAAVWPQAGAIKRTHRQIKSSDVIFMSSPFGIVFSCACLARRTSERTPGGERRRCFGRQSSIDRLAAKPCVAQALRQIRDPGFIPWAGRLRRTRSSATWACLLNHAADRVDHDLGSVELNVVGTILCDRLRASRRKMCQLFLHLLPRVVDRFGKVGRKFTRRLLRVVG